MGRYTYEGREWFNVGSGCLLLAFACLVQLLWAYAGFQSEHWAYSLIYFAGFTLIGASLLTKRAFLALTGLIACVFFVVLDVPLIVQGFTIAPVYVSILAVISAFMLVIGALDYFGFITVKANLEGANYFITGGFATLLVWNIIHTILMTKSASAISWALNVLMYPFLIVSLVAMLSEIFGKSFIKTDEEVLNNLAFLFAVLVFIVVLVSWQSGILLSIFG